MAQQPAAKSKNNDSNHNHCPHVRQPFHECYCLNMNSGSIAKVVYFCHDKYLECPTYQKHNNRLEQA